MLYAQTINRCDLAIVDTAEQEQSIYDQLIEMLKAVGCNVTYKPLNQVMDQSNTRLALSRYKAVFFILGTDFLCGLGRSYVCAKVLEAIEEYARLPGVLVGLVFPSLRAEPGMNIVSACAPIFNRLGITVPRDAREFLFFPNNKHQEHKTFAKHIDAFLHAANIFLATPVESRPLLYHTTLNMPHAGIEFKSDDINKLLSYVEQPLHLLPMNNTTVDVIKQTLPYGLYWFNPIRKNHIFITTSSLLTFSGIAENFHICPINFMLRQQMLVMVQQMLWELIVLLQEKNTVAVRKIITTNSVPKLPISLASFDITKKLYGHRPKSRKIAWMEINIFEDVTDMQRQKHPDIDQKRTQQQHDLINYIFDAGIDGLWVTLNPHMYYSHRARLPKPEQELIFLRAVARFTRMLQETAHQKKRTIPRLWVGYEITNNIYEPHMPQHYAVDVYENVYKDLPVPTDYSFWYSEVVKPLEVLVKKWQNPELSHGVCLSGVVLDLEMYCRKKTGTFLTSMGFDAPTFNKFVQRMRRPWENMALRDRPLALMRDSLSRSYFQFLEEQACSVGKRMQQEFLRLIPCCDLVCYLPNINMSWFYKGLYKGLTTGKQPLYLLTFNSEFFAHEEWFKRNRIPVYHASVLLLSKLQKQQDFSLVDYFLDNHHGIWLNRFSRFIEPPSKNWTSVEQPGLPQEEYSSFMKYLYER